MRNSLVNTLYISSIFKQISGLNIINSVQWIRNSQAEATFKDGTVQASGMLSTLAMVNKLDYTIAAGNLNIRPMFKHLLLREHSSVLEAHGWSCSRGLVAACVVALPELLSVPEMSHVLAPVRVMLP